MARALERGRGAMNGIRKACECGQVACILTVFSLYLIDSYLHLQSMMDHVEYLFLLHHETETATVHKMIKLYASSSTLYSNYNVKESREVIYAIQVRSNRLSKALLHLTSRTHAKFGAMLSHFRLNRLPL